MADNDDDKAQLRRELLRVENELSALRAKAAILGSSNDNRPILTDGSRVRIQLEAEFVNGMALNVQAIGTFTPLAAWVFADGFARGSALLAAAVALLCFVGAFALHLAATKILKQMDL